MQVKITGHHLEVTDSMKEYVIQKLQRLERHFEKVTEIDVILSLEKLKHKAEATVYVNGNNLFADCQDDDMYAAIDALADKLDRQIIKRKEKITDHHRSEGSIKKSSFS